ncbi:putative glycosidase [Medicago truncatula]|uniref:Putative glycosidase n=1 Tax=Medicago truncatula TaxID=3880 RepID=A0A396H477_MEDTR|nr:putative glycosidase [Medicago truncatula]
MCYFELSFNHISILYFFCSDIVSMVAYAPLFLNTNDRKWIPDAIVFNSYQNYGTPSYWLQQLFIESSGATLLNSTLQNSSSSIVASAIEYKNSQDGKNYLRVKVVNFGNATENFMISINGLNSIVQSSNSSMVVLTSSNRMDENSFSEPNKDAQTEQATTQAAGLNADAQGPTHAAGLNATAQAPTNGANAVEQATTISARTNAIAQAGTNLHSNVTNIAAEQGSKQSKKQTAAAINKTAVVNIAAVNTTTTNTSGTTLGGRHVVGEVSLFVPRKSRTTGVKRSIREVGNVGTQQSVNKT